MGASIPRPVSIMRPPLLLPLLLAACATSPDPARESVPARPTLDDREPALDAPSAPSEGVRQESAPQPVEPLPWPEDFQGRATLLADRIRVEGPPGLLDHCVARSDDRLFLRTVKTTDEGLLQVVQPGPAAAGDPVRGQLDGWALAALQQLVLLERPGAEAVTVVAEGGVFWATPDGDEQRAARREFTAPLPSR